MPLGVCSYLFMALHGGLSVSVTSLSSLHIRGLHKLTLALQTASWRLSNLSSFYHSSEDSSTSSQTLVLCPGFNLLSIFSLCHYQSLICVNRTASIITIDFHVQSILASEVKAEKSSQIYSY